MWRLSLPPGWTSWGREILQQPSFKRGVEAATGPLSAGDVVLSPDLVISIAGDWADMVHKEGTASGKY